METKKDIGALVQQKLASFKDSPDDLVWNTIEGHLKKKRRRKALIIWLSGIAVLALLLLIWSNNTDTDVIEKNKLNFDIQVVNSADSLTNDKSIKISSNQISEQTATKQLVVNKSKDSNVSKHTNSTLKKHKIVSSNTTIENSLKNKIKNSSTPISDVTNTKLNEEKTNNDLSGHHKNQTAKKIALKEKLGDSVNEKLSLTKVISKETSKDSIIKDSQSKWSITPQLIPTYYGALNERTTNNFSLNYGILASYKMNEKFYFRIGVKKLDLNQDFMEVTQQLSYLQFPIDVKYIPFKNKLNPYFTGGFSFFSLEDINLNSAIEDYQSTAAVNLGVGLEKKIFSKLLINLESNFNYQLMPFSDNTKIKPFIITLNLGLEYRF